MAAELRSCMGRETQSGSCVPIYGNVSVTPALAGAKKTGNSSNVGETYERFFVHIGGLVRSP